MVYPFQKAVLLPLMGFDGEVFGALLFARRKRLDEITTYVVMSRLGESFAHSFQTLGAKAKTKDVGTIKMDWNCRGFGWLFWLCLFRCRCR